MPVTSKYNNVRGTVLCGNAADVRKDVPVGDLALVPGGTPTMNMIANKEAVEETNKTPPEATTVLVHDVDVSEAPK